MADNKTTIEISAIDKASPVFGSIGASMRALETGAGRLVGSFGALGASLSAGAFVAYVKGVIDAADEMNDLSQRVGIGIRDLAAFKLAADQNGTSLESLARGIKGLSSYIEAHGDKLRAAGIATSDAKTAMIQLADVFAAMPDGIDKTALATQLFGKAGMELIPMLNGGSKGLAEAAEKSKEYGERLAELAPQADRFNDRLAELKLNAEGLGFALGNAVFDGITKVKTALEAEVRAAPGSLAGLLLGNHVAAGPNIKGAWEIHQAQVAEAAGGSSASSKNGEAESIARSLLAHDKATAKIRTHKAAIDELAKASQSWLAQLDRESDSIAAQIAREQERIDEIGLTREEQDQLAASKLDLAAAAKEEEAATLDAAAAHAGPQHDAYVQAATDMREQAEQLRGLAELKRGAAAKSAVIDLARAEEEANRKAAEASAAEWKRVSDDVAESLTDAIFDGGMDAGEMLERYFKTLILAPTIQAVMAPIAGGVASAIGVPGAGGASGNSLLGTLSIMNALNSGNAGLYGAYTNFAGSAAGQWLGLSNAGSFVGPLQAGQSGIGLTSLGSGVQTALPYLGSIYQASQGNYGSAALSAAGAYFGGPLGAVIGGMLGGSLFGGGGSDPHNNAQVSGFNFGINQAGLYNVGSSDNTGVSSFVAGPTSGSGWWSDSTALPAAQVAAINAAVAATFAAGSAVAKLFGIDESVMSSISVDSRFNGAPSNGKIQGYFATVDQAITALGEKISLKLVPSLEQLQQAGETLAQTASRLGDEFLLTNQIATLLGKNAETAFGANSIAGRDQLVQMLGGTASAGSAVGGYYQNFYSEAERAAAAKGSIAATLQAIGVDVVPRTRDEFRDLVEAQDLATESGRAMFATLLSVSAAFAGVTEAATATDEALNPKFDVDAARYRTRDDYLIGQRTGRAPDYAKQDLRGQLVALTSEVKAGNVALASSLAYLERKMREWDGRGMPETRTL